MSNTLAIVKDSKSGNLKGVFEVSQTRYATGIANRHSHFIQRTYYASPDYMSHLSEWVRIWSKTSTTALRRGAEIKLTILADYLDGCDISAFADDKYEITITKDSNVILETFEQITEHLL